MKKLLSTCLYYLNKFKVIPILSVYVLIINFKSAKQKTEFGKK